MAFFKSRKAGDDNAASPRQPESIEAMRRRARHRLIGAVVLVLAGVIGFPVLFDTQPRPVAVDIPIEIPDRNKAKPLAPPRAQPQAPVAAAPSAVASGRIEPAPEEKETAAPVASAAPTAPVSKPESKPVAKPELVAEAATAVAADGRFVVQVGAFADATKAREARLRVEKAGLKTYTHVAETKDGKRIRVRVGPFAKRAEADKAAAKIKGLDLPAAILTL
jgi:DedD protein